MRRTRALVGVAVLAFAALAATIVACVAHEETTPRGYVIAPSVPADGGPFIDANVIDANR